MRTLSIEIPAGPYSRFDPELELPGRLPVRLEGRDESILARVLTFDVTALAIRVTLELPADVPDGLFSSTVPADGFSIAA
jgi:hypothetical protein